MPRNRVCRNGTPLAATALGIALTFSAIGSASPQDPVVQEDDRAGRLEEMRQLAREFPRARVLAQPPREVPLRTEPLHRWSDPTRSFSDGSLWTFGGPGRPIAAMTIELYPKADSVAMWSFEFLSLASGPITVEGGREFEPGPGQRSLLGADGMVRWTPREAGIRFGDIEGAPAPAPGRADRLRQIKGILGRFSARETYGNPERTYELRALPHPIDRYDDPASEIIDGAIFVLANGTNPELLLLIEAQGRDPGPAIWRFAPARLGQAELSLGLDKKVVWTTPSMVRADPNEGYFNARRPRVGR